MQHRMLRRLVLIMVFSFIFAWGIAMMIPGIIFDFSGLLSVGAAYAVVSLIINVFVGWRLIQYSMKNKSLKSTFMTIGVSAIVCFVPLSFVLSTMTYFLIRPKEQRVKEYGWRRIPYFRKYIPRSFYEEKKAVKRSVKAAARARYNNEGVSASAPAPTSIAASTNKERDGKLDLD